MSIQTGKVHNAGSMPVTTVRSAASRPVASSSGSKIESLNSSNAAGLEAELKQPEDFYDGDSGYNHSSDEQQQQNNSSNQPYVTNAIEALVASGAYDEKDNSLLSDVMRNVGVYDNNVELIEEVDQNGSFEEPVHKTRFLS